MKAVISKQYIYNSDSLIVKEGVVIRFKLTDGSIVWTSMTGVPIKDDLSKMLETRYMNL